MANQKFRRSRKNAGKNAQNAPSGKNVPQRSGNVPVQHSGKNAPQQQNYDNNLRGVLFRNNRKTNAVQPDYTGQSEIEGVEYWIAAWVKVSKKGQSFMSLAFTEKESQNDNDNDDQYIQNIQNIQNNVDDLPF